jgi:predicted glycosyltransferase
LAYLHPNWFTPQRDLLPEALRLAPRYFLLRFASLRAHHDASRRGIDDALALRLIEVLRTHGQVYITSERPFGESLEPYRIPIHPALMHHALAFAGLYIGDSQTMAAEAAVLGVPSIRYNDFVGELSYLEELEHRYQLTKGLRTGQPEALLELAASWAADTALLALWRQRRAHLLSETIDVTPFWVDTFLKLAR